MVSGRNRNRGNLATSFLPPSDTVFLLTRVSSSTVSVLLLDSRHSPCSDLLSVGDFLLVCRDERKLIQLFLLSGSSCCYDAQELRPFLHTSRYTVCGLLPPCGWDNSSLSVLGDCVNKADRWLLQCVTLGKEVVESSNLSAPQLTDALRPFGLRLGPSSRLFFDRQES